ncbi:MAG: hypothetical protein U0263_31030 [Polyangiaceae bacterium]
MALPSPACTAGEDYAGGADPSDAGASDSEAGAGGTSGDAWPGGGKAGAAGASGSPPGGGGATAGSGGAAPGGGGTPPAGGAPSGGAGGCGNKACDNGENCDSCPSDCGCQQCYARCCKYDALHGPKMVQSTQECVDWGSAAGQCGSVGNLVRVQVAGTTVWEQPNRCWVKCSNYTVYHLLSGVKENCADAGKADCVGHGSYQGVIWQYCDPTP